MLGPKSAIIVLSRTTRTSIGKAAPTVYTSPYITLYCPVIGNTMPYMYIYRNLRPIFNKVLRLFKTRIGPYILLA